MMGKISYAFFQWQQFNLNLDVGKGLNGLCGTKIFPDIHPEGSSKIKNDR